MDKTRKALELVSVKKHFGKIRAVDGISLDVQAGTVLALLGANGAGKTTTLDLILHLNKPDAGEIRVLGRRPKEAIAAGEIAAVLQTGGLLNDMCVGEVIWWIASTFGKQIANKENCKRVMQIAKITELRDRKIGKCSGGEQQRIKFALSLLSDPEILVLDEPTAGMDANARHEFWKVMQAQAAKGKTIIFATHYLQEAQDYADRIVLMQHGKIIADGTVGEITAQQQRKITFTVPPAEIDPTIHALTVRFPELKITQIGDWRLMIETQNSDEFARELLQIPAVSNLEIAAPSLETAFFTLTRTDTQKQDESENKTESSIQKHNKNQQNAKIAQDQTVNGDAS
ncbi:ABC transporter ATP-binding protein [Arcanobacterium hippocoleae]|uniref:ABC transporter ATP-binding protein n=1 Tax=Arcanobacterium hippocoleae TaxID=149017 RepID=UPI0033420B46